MNGRGRATRWAPAAVAVAVASCAGGTRSPAATTLPPEVSDRLDVVAEEFRFRPARWAVPAGTAVTVELTNDGTVPHEWAVLRRGTDLASLAEFREDLVLFEVEAVPEGMSATGRFTVDEPGRYQVICALEGHLEAGMTGVLTVV